MKNLIDNLGITHRQFAELYGIPYRTVASWYTGERTTPKWVKSLIEQIIELKKNGKQITIDPFTTYVDIINDNFKTTSKYINGYYKNKVIEIRSYGEKYIIEYGKNDYSHSSTVELTDISQLQRIIDYIKLDQNAQ